MLRRPRPDRIDSLPRVTMSTKATTLADIASVDWSLELGIIGSVVHGIDDIDQCIAIILTTPPGADPLRSLTAPTCGDTSTIR